MASPSDMPADLAPAVAFKKRRGGRQGQARVPAADEPVASTSTASDTDAEPSCAALSRLMLTSQRQCC